MTEEQQKKSASPVVLCFSGYDPSGGAGLLADARACTAFNTFAVAVQTALVVQNTTGVRSTFPSTTALIDAQFDALDDDLTFAAVKVGVVPSIEIVMAVSQCLKTLRDRNPKLPIVIDPVFGPSNGKKWGDEPLFEAIQNELFPLATLVTPNTPEASLILDEEITDLAAMGAAARRLFTKSRAKNVLIKGGHIAQLGGERRGDQRESLAIDVFFDGIRETQFRAKFLENREVRGTGCLLSSAITAQMAQGIGVLEAAQLGKIWLFERIKNAQIQGAGQRVAVF